MWIGQKRKTKSFFGLRARVRQIISLRDSFGHIRKGHNDSLLIARLKLRMINERLHDALSR